MNLLDIKDKTCADLVPHVEDWNGLQYLVTAFEYPDGDSINLYSDMRKDSYLSDRGEAIFKLFDSRVELTDARRDMLNSICNQFKLTLDEDFFLSRRVDHDNVTEAILSFGQAISQITALVYNRYTAQRSGLKHSLDQVLFSRVKPYRAVAESWVSSDIDPDGVFPVDYRINGHLPPRHIYYIISREKSAVVSATCSFLMANDIFAPTLAVIEPELRLGRKHTQRLASVSTFLRYGVEGNEDFITEFSLSESDIH